VYFITSVYNSEDELVKAFTGQDAIVSAVGGPGFTQQRAFILAAIKAGVKHFVPSEYSTNTRSDAVRRLVPLFEAKQKVLNLLKEKESPTFSWTGLATGPLLDWVGQFGARRQHLGPTDVPQGIQSGFLGFDIASKKAKIWDGGEVVFSAMNQDDIAKAVVSILQHPVETANKYLYVETAAVSQMQILKSLEAATGQAWVVERVKTAELVALGQQLVAAGDFTGNFLLVQASVWGNGERLRQNFAIDEALANEMLGVPKGNLDETVKRVVDAAGSK